MIRAHGVPPGPVVRGRAFLRIALRLESAGDSQDVIDSPAAAGIGSRQWGRAYYRLSAREVPPVQTALPTGVAPQLAVTAPVTAAPFLLGLPSAGPSSVRTSLGVIDAGLSAGPTPVARIRAVSVDGRVDDVTGMLLLWQAPWSCLLTSPPPHGRISSR